MIQLETCLKTLVLLVPSVYYIELEDNNKDDTNISRNSSHTAKPIPREDIIQLYRAGFRNLLPLLATNVLQIC